MDADGFFDNYNPLLPESLLLKKCIYRYKSALVDKNWFKNGKIKQDKSQYPGLPSIPSQDTIFKLSAH